MTYLLNHGKPIIFSKNEIFLCDCVEALKNSGYELSYSEHLKNKKKLSFDISEHGNETVLGSASMPSVAKTIVDFFEATHHVHLEYEYVG